MRLPLCFDSTTGRLAACSRLPYISMMASSHLLVGLGTWAALRSGGLIPPDIALALPFAAGSLLPDIDHPGSYLGRRLWLVSYPLSRIFSHRGMTHSMLGLAILAGMAAGLIVYFSEYTNLWYAGCLVGGVISHIGCDYLTNTGIELLYPKKTRYRFPLGTFNTGSAGEMLFSGAFLVILVCFFVPHGLIASAKAFVLSLSSSFQARP